MTTYTKVVIETDSKGRMSISAVDDRDCGGGYRLAGPKYAGDNAPVIARCVLDARTVAEIRSYLATWDVIQARNVAATSGTSDA